MEDINPLTKLANRARKKFNKKQDEKEQKLNDRKINAEYIYKIFDNEKENLYFMKKTLKILSINPDTINPLGQLIDYKVFNNLNDVEKDRYIVNLTNKYLNALKNKEVNNC